MSNFTLKICWTPDRKGVLKILLRLQMVNLAQTWFFIGILWKILSEKMDFLQILKEIFFITTTDIFTHQ